MEEKSTLEMYVLLTAPSTAETGGTHRFTGVSSHRLCMFVHGDFGCECESRVSE